MANPTTNFGWVMPTSSSLVTNLPADFNTFGQAVDTSMSELLGGTTGQVLSKTSNTNMDFTWVTPTDQTPLTTKGDLFTFSTVDARLGVGTNGQVLTADSTAGTGLAWATPAGGGAFTLLSTTTLTGTNLSITGIVSTYKHLFVLFDDATNSGTGGTIQLGVNAQGNNNFYTWKITGGVVSTSSANQYGTLAVPAGSGKATGSFWIYDYSSSSFWKSFSSNAISGTGTYAHYSTGGGINLTTAISSLQFVETGSGFAAGTVKIYGVN